MNIKQTTQVFREGKSDCNHLNLPSGVGSINIFKLSHTVRKACVLCGRHVEVTTCIDRENPFTYKKILQRFEQEEIK